MIPDTSLASTNSENRWSAGPILLGVLCFSGQLKSVSLGPLDLTVVSGLVLFVVIIREIVVRRPIGHSSFVPVLVLFGLFALPVMWTSWFQYSYEKVPRLFTLTLLSALGGAIFLRSERGRREFLLAITAIAFVSVMSATASVASHTADLRVTGASASQIATGNAFGIALIALLGVAARARVLLLRLGTVALIPLCAVGLVASGARSALAATGIAIVVLGVLSDEKNARVWVMGAVGSAVLGCGILLWVFASDLPFSSVLRILEFLQGETGDGGEARVDYISKCLGAIPYYPWGTGWGGFAYLLEGTTERSFPHNLALEITLEAGWLAGIAFVVMLWKSLVRAVEPRNELRSWTSLVFAALLVFAVVSSFVTGEINDSRWLFALLFGALAAPQSRIVCE